MVQADCGASVLPQLLLSPNPAPTAWTLSWLKAVPPEFVSVIVCVGALCPTWVAGNINDVGDNVSVGGAVPVPDNDTL